MKKSLYIAGLGTLMALASCDGLDQMPTVENTANQVYQAKENYLQTLGKCYASFVTTGQTLNGQNDLASNQGHDFFRGYINLQEAPTDVMISTWIGGDKLDGLTYMRWDAQDPWVADTYYHLYYTISLCNSFIRNAQSASVDVDDYKQEARFLRALSYLYVLDLFHQGPFVDENSLIGKYVPEVYDAKQLFDYVESELKDLSSKLSADPGLYHANQASALALLTRLYLNAEVYIGKKMYDECIEAGEKIVASDKYELNDDYFALFNADNNLRTNEIIFSFAIDATTTPTWGSTTYLVCGQAQDKIKDTIGVESSWNSFRARPEFIDLFVASDVRGKFDYSNGKEITNVEDQSNGVMYKKWSNMTDEGKAASATGTYGVSTDMPVIRYAEVLLNLCEAIVRGGQGASRSAMDYYKWVSNRAQVTNVNAVTLQNVLDERGRELYLEGFRRTDLIRFGKFAGATDYQWAYKGGVAAGKDVDAKFNVYPIPQVELSANPNLKNQNY
ncbi:MAG: RagB/SusD family nutrient uptake outer membrane protein [Bacteroidales bacterium]|nr:RagB/SusD family nutrient uptake outer membrane protein [Bacteroidales bacterium]